MRRPAKNSATSATPMKIGRYGSSAVRLPIQAPDTPKVMSTIGPRQQVEARMAARPLPAKAPPPLPGSGISVPPPDPDALPLLPSSSTERKRTVSGKRVYERVKLD